MPVKALEDALDSVRLGGAEVGEEVEESSEDSEDFWKIPLAFNSPRHLQEIAGDDLEMQTWRMRERMKTVSVALVICLNVGVDPPDVTKTQPCARKECWIDPMSLNPQKAVETIGNSLQRQYERWQPRARYRLSLDPTYDEVKRLTTGLRRSARDERVLFHYNGHGVPKPTTNGEIWVFNRSFTQYIPLSIYELQTWMGTPSIYVYDCNNAGIIVDSFKTFAEQHEREYAEQIRNMHSGASQDIPNPPSLRNCIQLAACGSDQLLPMSPDLPADLFTACLTTPIKVALRWFVMKNEKGHLGPKVSLDDLEKIPGQFGDRRTMLGELNWIFTAITDTIAWNTLPRETFQKLFRQDQLVASLFRNFLLAERILRSCDCSPVSNPPLPPTHQHPMWEAWDMAVDMCLSQLKGILEHDKVYAPSTFFEEQLTAFEVWLTQGSELRSPPEQLPIVLQVLLSKAHRLRALHLLGRFLDLGPWAVNLILSVGIYPYVLKLLQANPRELRPLLVFLWAKILAVDGSCQQDLVRDQSHRYFLGVLQDSTMLPEHKTWSVFVLSSIVQGYKPGQDEALGGNLITMCLNELEDSDPVLRQWLAICLGRIWDRHEDARWRGARDNAPERLFNLLADPVPEVRTAAVYALGTFLNSCGSRTDHANSLDQSIGLRLLQTTLEDGSPLVRRELVVALQWIVRSFLPSFVNLCRALQEEDEERCRLNNPTTSSSARPTSPRPSASRLQGEDPRRRTSEVVRKNSRLGSNISSQTNMSSSSSVNEMNLVGVGEGSAHSTPRKARRLVVPQLNSSYSALASLSSFTNVTGKFKPFFLKVWGGLLLLEKDPDPMVVLLARSLLDIVWRKMNQKDKSVDMYRSHGHLEIHSRSAPNSPVRPTFLIGESPPSKLNTTLPSHLDAAADNRQPWLQRSLVASINEDGILEDGDNNAISTQFIEWAAKHFSTKLMRLEANSNGDSDVYWSKEWMYSRNEKLRRKADHEKSSLQDGSGRIDDQVGVAKINQPPSVITMHPYDTDIVVAGRDTISVYDFTLNPHRSHSFSNKNPKISQITALEMMNRHEEGLLVTGSDDGVVRVYKDWQEQHGQSLVTAWNLVPELVPQAVVGNRLSCGLRLAWDPATRVLAAAGDTKFVRLWDCNTELKLIDLPSATDSFVTSLSMNESVRLLAAAHNDGSIRLYDPRNPPASARVMQYREHGRSVLTCVSQPGGRLVSGCTDGIIKVWDMRRQSSISTIKMGQSIAYLDIHQNAPLFAAWTMSSQLSVHSLVTGKAINQIRYHEGILGHRLGSLNCLRFHPNLLELAAGAADSFLSVYGIRRY